MGGWWEVGGRGDCIISSGGVGSGDVNSSSSVRSGIPDLRRLAFVRCSDV